MRSLVASSLAVLLIAPPAEAVASPESDPGTQDNPVEDDDPVGQAEALYQQGVGKFETADYDGAIAKWTEAYTLVPSTADNAEIKAILISNLAAAHERAFDVDADAGHLRQAKILLEEYVELLPLLYPADGELGDELAKEQAETQERQARIDEKLAAATEAGPGPGPGPGPVPGPGPKAKPSKALIISGGVLLGVGAAGLGVGFAGMGLGASANDIPSDLETDPEKRGEQFARGRNANLMAIVGSAAGGALLVTGVILLGIGLKRRSDAKGKISAAPLLGPSSAGVVLTGRF